MVRISRKIIGEPLSVEELNAKFAHKVSERTIAKATTPVSNGHAVDITGVDEVLLSNGDVTYQCVYCGNDYESAVSTRSHLIAHSRRKQETEERRIESAQHHLRYETDLENFEDWLRYTEAIIPTLKRVLRELKSKRRGQLSAEQLSELRAKANAFDAAQRLFSK